MTAYNIYVKKKEKDLRSLIFKLHEKNDSSNFQESRITNLELTISQLRDKANEDEKEIEQMKKE